MKRKFNLKKYLEVFHQVPISELTIIDFEEALEAITSEYKRDPETLHRELMRYFYRYMLYKNDIPLIEILNGLHS